jgi:hemerythrin
MATATALLFPWSDTYSVNIGIIDSQHKVLVDLINELHQAMRTRTGKEHKDWLINHIMRVDKRYVSHLSARGVR